MTFDLWRSGASKRLVGTILALLAAAGFGLLPTQSATAQSAAGLKIVSVDVTGNVHVPTQTIMGVVEARPGQPYDPKVVQEDLARINALGTLRISPRRLCASARAESRSRTGSSRIR